MSKSNVERQREWAARQRERGFVPLTVWVPASQYADVKLACIELCDAGVTLELGPFRNYSTGKLVRRRKA